MKTKRLKDKVLVAWNTKQETLIKRYVDLLSRILKVNSKGNVETSEIAKLEVYLKILAQNITIQEISDLETKRQLIFRATFTRFGKYKSKDIHTFRKALAAETNQYLARPVQKFKILFPLNVRPGEFDKFHSFSILNKKLLVRNWNYVQKHFEYSTLMTEVKRHSPSYNTSLTSYFVPILITTEAQDYQQAFNKASRAFDLFRSLLNLQLKFGTSTMQFGGYPKPLGKIFPPPIYGIFDEHGKYVRFYYNTVRDYQYMHNSIPDDRIVQVRKLASKILVPKSDDDTVSLNIEVLEKYGEALDTSEWRLSFLVLWQILELIALQSNEELSMKNVVNRINIIFGQNQLIRDLLSALYQTRNLLVHKGQFPSEQALREVNLLKYIVEPCMNFILSKTKYLPTKNSLNKYYEHAASNNADLAERERIISLIKKSRARKKK